MTIIQQVIKTPPIEIWRKISRLISGQEPLLSFDNEHPCIFVLSTGRVGTETLSALLNLCPNILSLHEPRPLLYSMSKSSYKNTMLGCESVWNDAFLSLRADLIGSALSGGVGYAETSPQCTFLAPAIYRSIQNVKFIHLVRHPADVVRSGLRRGWYAGHPADETRIRPIKGTKESKFWSAMSQLEKNAWLWSETNKWIYEYTHTLPEENYFFLKAEDIYNANKTVLNELYKFCSVKSPNEKKINKLLSKKLNSQNVGDFPSFEHWSSTEVSELKSYAGEIASLMGYRFDRRD